MSGYTNRRNLSAAGKSDSRVKHKNVGSRTEWKPKAKIATDESLDGPSCCQKDSSSLAGEFTSGKMSSFNSKPSLDIHLQQESLLPLVSDVASGMGNLKLMPDSCQRADNTSKHLGSISTSDCSSLVNMYATPTKPSPVVCFSSDDGIPQKGNPSGDISQEKASSSSTSEDTDRVSSIMRFDICPERDNAVVKLKAPLHVKNKEKRNQIKRSEEGQNIVVLRPGMVLMKGYISSVDQISIVKVCRELGIGDGGFYQPGYREGSKLHLKMMCLGKNWDPESSKYGDTRPIDNAKPPGIPDNFHDIVKRAIQDSNAHIQKIIARGDAGKIIPSMSPDICIVNFYTKGGKLGLHQDKDESAESLKKELPVVSFSIGDSAEFLYGDGRDIDEAVKVILKSGDVLIFGGKSRHIFHGVASVHPDTAPTSLLEATDLIPGRLNLTFRQY